MQNGYRSETELMLAEPIHNEQCQIEEKDDGTPYISSNSQQIHSDLDDLIDFTGPELNSGEYDVGNDGTNDGSIGETTGNCSLWQDSFQKDPSIYQSLSVPAANNFEEEMVELTPCSEPNVSFQLNELLKICFIASCRI